MLVGSVEEASSNRWRECSSEGDEEDESRARPRDGRRAKAKTRGSREAARTICCGVDMILGGRKTTRLLSGLGLQNQ